MTDKPVQPDKVQDLLTRCRARRGADQMRRLRGQTGDTIWQWINEKELMELVESQADRIAELEGALVACVAVVKVWHAADDVWDIYYQHSPEMKPIRAAITPKEKT